MEAEPATADEALLMWNDIMRHINQENDKLFADPRKVGELLRQVDLGMIRHTMRSILDTTMRMNRGDAARASADEMRIHGMSMWPWCLKPSAATQAID